MNKKEFYVIGLGLGILIPIILFVLFWWPVSALNIHKILSVPESFIKIFVLSGFTLGIMVDILFLKKLIHKFYKIKISFLILLYVFCSMIAVAFFMGLPIGNLFLGIAAGLYIGRKYHHLGPNIDKFLYASKVITLFTAFVTSFEALPIAFFALQEESLIESLNQFLGLQIFSINSFIDFSIIIFLCIILFIIQFFSTKVTSKIAFTI